MKANRDQHVCHRHQHCVYAIPAWGGFLSADLKSHINGFLRRLHRYHRYGYTSTVFNVELHSKNRFFGTNKQC